MDNQSNNTPETVQDAVQQRGEQASPSPAPSEEQATPAPQPSTFKEEVGEPKGQTGEKKYTQEQNNSYHAGMRKGIQEMQEQLATMVKPMVESTIQETLAKTPTNDAELRQKVENMEYRSTREDALNKYVSENPDDLQFKDRAMALAMSPAHKDLPTADLVGLVKLQAGYQSGQPINASPTQPAPQNAPAVAPPNQAQMNAMTEQEKQALIQNLKHGGGDTGIEGFSASPNLE